MVIIRKGFWGNSWSRIQYWYNKVNTSYIFISFFISLSLIQIFLYPSPENKPISMEDLNNQFEESFQEYITSILQINEVPYFNYTGKQTASGPSSVKFISGKKDTINIKRNYSEDIEKMQLKMLSSIIRL